MPLEEEYPKTRRKLSARLQQRLELDASLGDEERDDIASSMGDMVDLASDLVDIVNRLIDEKHTPAEIGELLIAFELTTEQLRGHSETIDGKLYEIGDRLKGLNPAKKVRQRS